MRLRTPEVVLEQVDLSPLLDLLGEAFRADGSMIPKPDDSPPPRAFRDSPPWQHYVEMCKKLETVSQKLAQDAFNAGVAFAAYPNNGLKKETP